VFGGAVLGTGAVQEEILLLQYPETLVGLLLFKPIQDSEAVAIFGARRMSYVTGYNSNMKFDGVVPINLRGGRKFGCSEIIAIDALQFHCKNSMEEKEKKFIDRELLKAFTGFNEQPATMHQPLAIGSGKWGCGVFNASTLCCYNFPTLHFIQYLTREMWN
jgi:Poly (ADP-ribose) glycohydrolase (PARG)